MGENSSMLFQLAMCPQVLLFPDNISTRLFKGLRLVFNLITYIFWVSISSTYYW